MGWIVDDEKQAVELASKIKTFQGGMHRDFRLQLDRNPFTLKFWLRHGNNDIARFTLTQMVNCCGIVVSTDAWVETTYRGKGIAQEMLVLKEAIAKAYGYSCMMATVNMTGSPTEVHILQKAGWEKVNEFTNSRTRNQVGVFVKNLRKA